MSIHIKGQNFQPWENFDLKVEGLTVLIGPSNKGKSSLERCFKGLVRNKLSSGQVRNGSDAVEISAEIDGHNITARRTRKGSVKYTVDGKEYAKLGRDVPEPIKALALNPIQIGDITLDPIFARQGERMFLLEDPPMVLNTVLGAFSSTERLELGKRSANLKISEKNAEARVIAVEVRTAEERKAALELLSNRADTIQANMQELQPQVENLEKLAVTLDAAIFHLEELKALRAVINQIVIPDTQAAQTALLTCTLLDQTVISKRRHAAIQSLAAKIHPPDIEPALRSANIVRYSQQAARAQQKLTLNRACMDSISLFVDGWKPLVATANLFIAIKAAEAAVTALAASSTKVFSEKLDAIVRAVEAKQPELVQAGAQLHWILQFQKNSQALAILNINMELLEQKITEVKATEQKISAERQQHLAESAKAALAKIAKHTAKVGQVTCPKCGEEFVPPANHPNQHEYEGD